MTNHWLESRIVWIGTVTTYIQPGSFPQTSEARLVERGRNFAEAPHFTVEMRSKDAMGADRWNETADGRAIESAFSQYIQATRTP